MILNFLTTRTSTPAKFLRHPGPTADELQRILDAAECVPDHGRLHPWRFLIIEGGARIALGELFVAALRARDPAVEPALCERERERALRAPTLLAAIASPLADHPKVPEQEQRITAALAAYQAQLAAQALGFGAIWLTGSRVYDPFVTRALGLAPHEQLLGFINLGQIANPREADEKPRPSAVLQYWP
ncbi:nitroreductase [Halothiobacillus sp. DCM-1]|uniref:nitroreductase family protein n=1 Tax=Halothiobacillus sp. DCM-1 TaxID=3112558 RepID=UPI003252A810